MLSGMKVVIPSIIPNTHPCVVQKTERESFTKVISTAYCGRRENTGDGVVQIPDHAKCCPACEDAIKRAFPAP